MPHSKPSPTNQASPIDFNWRLSKLAEKGEYCAASHFTNGLLFCSSWNPLTETGYLESFTGPNQSGAKLDCTFFNDIAQMCSDSLGNVYIVGDQLNKSDQNQRGNYVVKKYNITSNTLTALDKTFNGKIQFVCCDSDNNIYVAGNFTDSSNQNCVMKFDVTKSEWQTVSDNNIGYPTDMCIDDNNRLYVLSSNTDKTISTVNYLDGTSWSTITSVSLDKATGIACDNDNHLFFNNATQVMAYNTLTKAYTDLGAEIPTYDTDIGMYLQYREGTLFVACCGYIAGNLSSSIFAHSANSWSDITHPKVASVMINGLSTTLEHPFIALPSNIDGILIGNPTRNFTDTESFLK